MKAAEELFLKDVFVKVSMRDISMRSGVGLSNIYNYFKGKDEIFQTDCASRHERP